MTRERDDISTKILRRDRMFLIAEGTRLAQERYRTTGEVRPSTVTETVSALFDELRDHRKQVEQLQEEIDVLEAENRRLRELLDPICPEPDGRGQRDAPG